MSKHDPAPPGVPSEISHIMTNIEVHNNNKRIVINTALLYFRMLITVFVSLYTSRVVLLTIGIQDFGIYNVVGSVVVLFSFLTNAMTGATQRFLNFELGRNQIESVARVFSMSMTAHISITIVAVILAETIGLWFLNTHLSIPADRMVAANWVFQFSLLTFCIQILRVPYNASIIAYEKMSLYAYISIAEICLRLGTVYLLSALGYDKLVLYSILMMLVAVMILFVYKGCCRRAFTTCEYSFFWDYALYKKLMQFSGWSMIGSVANLGVSQGLNVILNLFYGVAANAALGIAQQVSNTIYNFVVNFQMAFSPQIIKSYAQGDRKYLVPLVFQTSKFSFFLLLLLALPLLINSEFILTFWFGTLPPYTASFCRLGLACLMIEALAAPLWMLAQATGQIKAYQLGVAFIILMNIPADYLILRLGYSPAYVLLSHCIVAGVTHMARLIYLRQHVNFPVLLYIRKVLVVTGLILSLSVPVPWLCNRFISGWYGFVLTGSLSVLCTGIAVFFAGLERGERRLVTNTVAVKVNQLMGIQYKT